MLMKNPEFRRNLWLELSPQRLILMPLVLAVIGALTVTLSEAEDMARGLLIVFSVIGAALVGAWGRVVNAVVVGLLLVYAYGVPLSVPVAAAYAETLAVVGCAADSLGVRRRPWEIEAGDLYLPEWRQRIQKLLREAVPGNALPRLSTQHPSPEPGQARHGQRQEQHRRRLGNRHRPSPPGEGVGLPAELRVASGVVEQGVGGGELVEVEIEQLGLLRNDIRDEQAV